MGTGSYHTEQWATPWSLCRATACGRPSAGIAGSKGLLKFIYRKRGLRLLVVEASMTLVQNLCKLAATGGGLLVFASGLPWSYSGRSGERRSQILEHRKEQEKECMHRSTPVSTI